MIISSFPSNNNNYYTSNCRDNIGGEGGSQEKNLARAVKVKRKM